MRLLNTESYKLENFSGPKIPSYAILSHTWGDGEVLFQDMVAGRGFAKSGWNKITGACKTARRSRPPYRYIWIDTCCIDKTSSAELSEAINSMYRWYQGAAVCYAYLEDVKDWRQQAEPLEDALQNARWFSRGWTLQELIAPANVVFFAADWDFVGTKDSLRYTISSITGINVEIILKPQLLPTMSVARRMSWAAYRETTRVEDVAYCLMGIFGVNMPLLYGEGTKAFIRLQEEIIKDSEDQSLFAWQYPGDSGITEESKYMLENEGILADHPAAFKNSSGIVSYRTNHATYATTNRGLQIQIPISRSVRVTELNEVIFIGVLSCHYEHDISRSIGIQLICPTNQSSDRYYRAKRSELILVRHNEANSVAQIQTVHIHKSGKRPSQASYFSYCYLRKCSSEVRFSGGIVAPAVAPSANEWDEGWKPGNIHRKWDMDGQTAALSRESDRYFAALRFSPSISAVNDGFTVIVKLISNSGGTIGIIPSSLYQERSLSEILQRHYKKASYVKGSFHVEHGTLQVLLERTKLFGADTFALDIDYYPDERKAGTESLDVNTTPDIRLIEPDDDWVGATEVGSQFESNFTSADSLVPY
jgi:hypothetical protein